MGHPPKSVLFTAFPVPDAAEEYTLAVLIAQNHPQSKKEMR
jgi:hypothetical protein